jgi:penicillin-binding protein 2
VKRHENLRANVFTRRTLVVGGIKAAILAGLGGRLYALQISDGSLYRSQSEDNRIATRLLVPNRGLITDRFGKALALNVPSFELYITANKTDSIEATLTDLQRFVELSPQQVAEIYAQLDDKPSFVPVLVKRNLTQNQAMILEVRQPEMPGIEVREVLQRYYPDRESFAHIVGYVSAVTEKDVKQDSRALLRMPNFKIGKQGVERLFDANLMGKPGFQKIEVSASGRPHGEIERIQPAAGENLKLTLSRDLQLLTHQQLAKHRAGSAVLMDLHTGEVLSAVSHPGFDPNSFVRGFSTDEWQAVVNNPATPLNNKISSGVYAPGSTFKMIVALAAMKANISVETRVNCRGFIEVSNQRFHCWKREGHGLVNMHDALVHSCDVYYYELAQRLGIERIAAMAAEFGFGQRVSLDYHEFENPGLLPSRQWKETKLDRGPWNVGDTIQVSIGQGFMLATPLQLATMCARLATGRKVQPYFVAGQGRVLASKLDVDPYHLVLVQRMMSDVVNSDSGTARGSRIRSPAMSMAGKTGTAQVRRISIAEREKGVLTNDDIDYLQRDHSLFIGYGPVDQPRYATAVVIEHGGSGSAIAAPIARDLLSAAMSARFNGDTVVLEEEAQSS